MFSLKDQVALVTGASRGIGQAIGLALARQGVWVIGTATTTDGAKLFSQQLSAANLQGEGVVLDVCDHVAIEKLFNNLEQQEKLLSILVNNAGITRDKLLLSMTTTDWQQVLETNLSAAYKLSQMTIKHLLKRNRHANEKFGRIINISSVVGLAGNPGQSNYAAAKAGLIGFSKALAQEVATRGITVNVIAPGFIETDMTARLPSAQKTQLLQKIPSRHLGKPADVAAACVFLASKEAQYITGHTLEVNGGLHMV
jgi:3-oxoacyl-[acyl-carrier protein] reductase